MSNTDDIPLDYKWIDWEHLYAYVGRALLGDHVPLMTGKVVDYLEAQAKNMRRNADKLEIAAIAIRPASKRVQSQVPSPPEPR